MLEKEIWENLQIFSSLMCVQTGQVWENLLGFSQVCFIVGSSLCGYKLGKFGGIYMDSCKFALKRFLDTPQIAEAPCIINSFIYFLFLLTGSAYNLTFERFPRNIIRTLENGKVLEPSERREFVRCAVAELTERLGKPPGKQRMRLVSAYIVSKWPSLKDKIEGQCIGSGYQHLFNQSIRVDNNSRMPTRNSLKRNVSDGLSAKGKQANSYGCVTWQPELPERERMNKLK